MTNPGDISRWMNSNLEEVLLGISSPCDDIAMVQLVEAIRYSHGDWWYLRIYYANLMDDHGRTDCKESQHARG